MEDFETIWFQLDSLWYALPPNSYLLLYVTPIRNSRDYDVYCMLRIRSKKDKEYGVLGANFLENYFQLYDVTRNTLCLKSISENGTLLDAKGQNVIGFGEI